MALVAGQRGPEDAEQSHRTSRAQDVSVVLIQCVHSAGINLMDLSTRLLNDFAVACDAVVGLEMIRVLELEPGASFNLGEMEREFHGVVPT